MRKDVRDRMRVHVAALLPLALLSATAVPSTQSAAPASTPSPAWLEPYREPASRLIEEATKDTFAWRRLAALTDASGPRFSGTPGLDRAIQWALQEMKRDGLEDVHTEPVMIPKWVRGAESAEIIEPAHLDMAMLGLGDSVNTPPQGVQAEILIVHSFEDLETRGAQARGRIVVFNVPFTNYTESVRFRTASASRASAYGAVAVLVRSIGPNGLRLPHTGVLQYVGGSPQIPGAAIASEDADRLQRMVDGGSRVVVRLKMSAHFEKDVPSANVIGELRGREQPSEIVLVSGHLDSWDVGDGASDDGGGCVVTWEALRLMKKLNLRPRRTVRLVLWTNEENGGRGGRAYRERHLKELSRHILLMESDTGVARPLGFGFTGGDKARRTVETIATLLNSIGATRISPGGEGADIGPSAAEARIPSMSLDVDTSRFFVIHHTQADTVDKVDPAEMARSAAAVAVMTYVVADMPARLGD
jgi:carboxypeptidase Q